MFIGMDKNSEQNEAERSFEELKRIGYIQSPERFKEFEKDTPFRVSSLVRFWSEMFRPTLEEHYKDVIGEVGVFGEKEEGTSSKDARTEVKFWVENALKPRPDLEGSIWNEAKKKLIRVSTKKALEFTQLEDNIKATVEQQMSALLVTLANIEAVKPIMTDVYPALKWEAIAEAEEAMSLLLAEISRGKHVVLDKNTKVYVPRLGRSVAVPIITTMFIASFILAACGAQPVDAGGSGSHETLVVAATSTTSAKQTKDAPTRIASPRPKPTKIVSPTPKSCKTPTEIVTPTEVGSEKIIWPAQGTETISQVEELDLGMEFKDPEKAYREMLGALIANKEYNGKFLQALLGTETPTVDQFLAFLRESKGPDGRLYYMPFTVNGIEYKWLTGGDSSIYGLRYTPQVSKLREGVYLEDFTTMMFTLDEYKQYKEAIDKIFEYNSKGGIKPNVRFEMFGLMITPDGRAVFIQGNLENMHFDHELPAWAFEMPFGGADGIIDQTDIQKYTAGWMIYVKAQQNFTRVVHEQPNYCYMPTCKTSGGAVPYDDVTMEAGIVELK